MRVATASLSIVVILVAFSGCESSRKHEPSDTQAEHAAIDALRQRLEESFSSGDLAGMASVYAEDAAFSAPGYPIAHGRDEIRRVFELKRPPGSTATFRAADTRILAPDWAYEFGTITVTARVGPEEKLVSGESTYLVILQKSPTGWHVYREALSSNGPATGPQ